MTVFKLWRLACYWQGYGSKIMENTGFSLADEEKNEIKMGRTLLKRRPTCVIF